MTKVGGAGRGGDDEGGRGALARLAQGALAALARSAPGRRRFALGRDALAGPRRAATCRRPAASGAARRGHDRPTHAPRRSGALARGAALVLTLAAFAGAPAYISATNPASLAEANLNGATVTVSLGGLTYASGVSASSFALVTSPAIAGLTIANVTGGASGSTSATLTLATGTGFDFDTPATLAVRVLAAAHSGSTNVTTGAVSLAPTDEAPSGGNGALAYTVSGLPAGLVFDASGTDTNGCLGTEPREVCGTPTAATGGARTVTVTAQDADANRAAGDRDTLTFQVTVLDNPTVAANPSTLTEANLNGATLTVTLPSGTTFASGVSASSFALVTSPAIAGLSISNVTGGASGTRTATLTLATGAGYGFSTPATLAVRVRAAAHSGSTDLTSGTLAVSPTPGATLSRRCPHSRLGQRHRRRHGKAAPARSQGTPTRQTMG